MKIVTDKGVVYTERTDSLIPKAQALAILEMLGSVFPELETNERLGGVAFMDRLKEVKKMCEEAIK